MPKYLFIFPCILSKPEVRLIPINEELIFISLIKTLEFTQSEEYFFSFPLVISAEFQSFMFCSFRSSDFHSLKTCEMLI